MNLLDRLELRLSTCAQAEASTPQPSDAAVLLAITRGEEPQLLLTLRAAHLKSHGSQVAFPGGKWEPGDVSLVATALRETWEEVDLDPGLVEVLGGLPMRQSRMGVAVSPFVGLIPEQAPTRANPAEIDTLFKVPLRYFLETAPLRRDAITRPGAQLQVPVWQFGDFEIWGLTAMIIEDLLKLLDSP